MKSENRKVYEAEAQGRLHGCKDYVKNLKWRLFEVRLFISTFVYLSDQ
ncbi:MAG: hypothetical protein AB8B53_00495 [Flavobacteriales bacterium]